VKPCFRRIAGLLSLLKFGGVKVLKRNSSLILCAAALVMAGCTSNLLGGGSREPVADQAIPVGNQLALPPDLALRAPGTTTAAYQPNRVASGGNGGVYSDDANIPLSGQAATPRGTTSDPYVKYGVSRTNPDGSKKDESALREELRQAVIAEKRRSNPSYGTVGNIGDLFKDWN
jgi:hypothetical protein